MTPSESRDTSYPEAKVSLTRTVGSTPDLSPKEKRKVRLQIANPLPGGNSVISLYHAERYVRRGDACFDAAGRLVFTMRSQDTLIGAEMQLLRRTGRGYDLAALERLATRQELKHIPVVQPDRLLIRRGN